MQIAIPIKSYNLENVFFSYRTENTVVSGGGFYRAMYCDGNITIVGIPIKLALSINSQGSQTIEKIFEQYCVDLHEQIHSLINNIYSIWQSTQIKDYKLPLSYGHTTTLVRQAVQRALSTKSKNEGDLTFIFKCSGVFDTNEEAGVTYRLYVC